MNEEYITVREFLRNFKDFMNKNKTVIITKNGKPEGVYTPYKKWEKETPKKLKKVKITREFLEKFAIKGGDPYTSQKIDEILYGDNNQNEDEKNNR